MSIEVNGQEYQHATTRVQALTTGGTRGLKTHKKLSFKITAEKKASNRADGKIDSWTIDNEKHEGSITMKLSEYFALRAWLLAQNPGLGVLQCAFDLAVSYGKSVAAMKTVTLRGVMFQAEPYETEDNQDVLVGDHDIFFLSADLPDGPAVAYEE